MSLSPLSSPTTIQKHGPQIHSIKIKYKIPPPPSPRSLIQIVSWVNMSEWVGPCSSLVQNPNIVCSGFCSSLRRRKSDRDSRFLCVCVSNSERFIWFLFWTSHKTHTNYSNWNWKAFLPLTWSSACFGELFVPVPFFFLLVEFSENKQNFNVKNAF